MMRLCLRAKTQTPLPRATKEVLHDKAPTLMPTPQFQLQTPPLSSSTSGGSTDGDETELCAQTKIKRPASNEQTTIEAQSIIAFTTQALQQDSSERRLTYRRRRESLSRQSSEQKCGLIGEAIRLADESKAKVLSLEAEKINAFIATAEKLRSDGGRLCKHALRQRKQALFETSEAHHDATVESHHDAANRLSLVRKNLRTSRDQMIANLRSSRDKVKLVRTGSAMVVVTCE